MAISKGVRTFVMQLLRRGTYRWPGRFNSLKKANQGRNQYLCAGCGGIFKKKEINLDHIEPVIPVEGTEDFNVIIERMYAMEDGWQVLCSVPSESNGGKPKGCHGEKTEIENEQRRDVKKVSRKKK